MKIVKKGYKHLVTGIIRAVTNMIFTVGYGDASPYSTLRDKEGVGLSYTSVKRFSCGLLALSPDSKT